MATTYFGILNDGHIVEKLTLDEVNDIEGIEYIVRCVVGTEWNTPKTYTILDVDGSKRKFVIGNFEVMDIGEETGGSYGKYPKKVLIKDHRTNTNFETVINTQRIAFFKQELIPLLEKLNEVGSWEMYQKLIELDEAYKEIQQLKATILKLEDQLAKS